MVSTFKKDNVIFVGVVTVFLLFLFLLYFAVYLFYTTVVVEQGRLIGPMRGEIFKEEDIDKVVKILDGRAQKSEGILGD